MESGVLLSMDGIPENSKPGQTRKGAAVRKVLRE